MFKRSLYFKFSLAIIILLADHANSQTLSNLSLLQRRRVETDMQSFSGSFNNNTDKTKFQPNWIRTGAPAPAAAVVDKRTNDELQNWQDASLYARDNPDEFSRLLEMQSRYKSYLPIDPNSADIRYKTLAYAALALQDPSTLESYLTDNGFDAGSTERRSVENEIRALKTAIARITSPTISVFATGNIRSIATNKAPEPTTTGTGSLGATYASSKNVYSAQFSVASTLDSTKSGFGSYLLAPLNGKSLKSAIIEWFPKLNWSQNSWLHVYGNFASSLWEVQKDSIYRNVSTLGLGLLYHHRIFEGLIAETEVGLDGEIGLAGRWLSGDVRNLLNSPVSKAKYLNIFPTEKNFFTGIEGGLSLNFGQVVGALQAFYIFPKKDEPIDGLTGLQLSVGLSVRGDIIRGFLTK